MEQDEEQTDRHLLLIQLTGFDLLVGLLYQICVPTVHPVYLFLTRHQQSGGNMQCITVIYRVLQ